ncbi:MAG: hypothetical protein WKF67_06405 [Rubrobacteraceae bacterium]
MAENQQQSSSASNNKALIFLFWAYVTVPLIWAIYRTFGNISALLSG